jgi:hypothetical protein
LNVRSVFGGSRKQFLDNILLGNDLVKLFFYKKQKKRKKLPYEHDRKGDWQLPVRFKKAPHIVGTGFSMR